MNLYARMYACMFLCVAARWSLALCVWCQVGSRRNVERVYQNFIL
jgi:hypothetical protein